MIEIVVKISDDESSLVQKHLIHDENLTISHDDPTLKRIVQQAIDDFKPRANEKAQEIVVKMKYSW